MSITRVLIVEDEKIIALDLQLRIKEMGFKVLGAVSNGADALKIALNQELDLVLMDVNIDGDINGIETAQIIKEHKEVPIIFTDRTKGTSKMSANIFKEAIFGVIQLKINSLFKRYQMAS
jgi:DNA-binding response OmpR family regulator